MNTVLSGRYQIASALGRGGMGAVYLARDRRFQQRYVALKENFQRDAASQAQFRHEAEVLARLSHPHLPRVTDNFITPAGRQFLVMDYISGTSLAEHVARHGAAPEAKAILWLEQILDAVGYLHAQQPPVIHRDIKPANVRITQDERAVLVDFGLTKFLVPGQATASVVRQAGSPGFAPPEQYAGGTDRRTDIYGVGATFYFALTGQAPPEAPLRLSGREMARPRDLNADISTRTARVLEKAMALKSQERYPNAEAMGRALHSSPLASLWGGAQAGQHAGRRPLASVGLAALLILVIGLGLFGGWQLIGGDDRGDGRKDAPPVATATTMPTAPTVTPNPASSGEGDARATSTPLPDRDGDGFHDGIDVCPDSPGPGTDNGCPGPSGHTSTPMPDRDGDGVPDARDQCPDEAADTKDGCPDSDGDGITDKNDACPQQSGPACTNGCPDADADGDCFADTGPDQCPGVYGEQNGCPDRDGDGVLDQNDECPDQPGASYTDGCPDRDGDGVHDGADVCPDYAGPADNHGCPDQGNGDGGDDGPAPTPTRLDTED